MSLHRKIRKMTVAQENQKEVLLRDLYSGVTTRNTNKDPVLFMDMVHLLEHQHQAHLSHLEVTGFMSEVIQYWCLRWHDLENTRECFFQHMKCLCFIHTWYTPLEMLLTLSTLWTRGMLSL